MRVRMAFGLDGREIELPDANVVDVLTMPQLPDGDPPADPEAAVAHALAHPIGSAPLRELAGLA